MLRPKELENLRARLLALGATKPDPAQVEGAWRCMIAALEFDDRAPVGHGGGAPQRDEPTVGRAELLRMAREVEADLARGRRP